MASPDTAILLPHLSNNCDEDQADWLLLISHRFLLFSEHTACLPEESDCYCSQQVTGGVSAGRGSKSHVLIFYVTTRSDGGMILLNQAKLVDSKAREILITDRPRVSIKV